MFFFSTEQMCRNASQAILVFGLDFCRQKAMFNQNMKLFFVQCFHKCKSGDTYMTEIRKYHVNLTRIFRRMALSTNHMDNFLVLPANSKSRDFFTP